jgi:hypothetical protein
MLFLHDINYYNQVDTSLIPNGYSMNISVIICTHNPRAVYLRRALDALRAQTLDPSNWELLLIDNCSEPPVEGRFDVSWHNNGKIINEDQLGLTPARLRGIRESVGDILCFVDDDNVLDPDYLEQALKIGTTLPHIGCWGGEILAEYETPPPYWFKGCEPMLVIRPLVRDRWSNAYQYDDAMPCGAGLCTRRTVVENFVLNCMKSDLRHALGRCGNSMGSGEDVDLAYTAIDMEMGTGRFKAMRMLHLIPNGRLMPEYLVRLAEGMAETDVYLDFLRRPDKSSFTGQIPINDKIQFLLQWIRAPRIRKRMLMAKKRGRMKAIQRLRNIHSDQNLFLQ